MKLIILGSGAARPEFDRALPGQVVLVDDEPVMFDCGPGAGMNYVKAGISLAKLDSLFLTHLHIDHVVEYPAIVLGSYLYGRNGPFRVYGPKGTKVFSETVFEKLYPYAFALVKNVSKTDLTIESKEVEPGLIYRAQKWKVSGCPVEHGFPTFAYKIESNGKSIVVSGDTAPCKALIELSHKATVLVMDCSFPDDMATVAKATGHSTPGQVGQLAKEAEVEKVVLTHIFSFCRGREEEMLNSVRKAFSGEVIMGKDLLQLDV
jgi:ribonuclease Z